MSEMPVAPMMDPSMQQVMDGPSADPETRDACLLRKIMNSETGPIKCPPPSQDGCCCLGGAPAGNMMESDCNNIGGTFLGAGTSCTDDSCSGMYDGPALNLKDLVMKGVQKVMEEQGGASAPSPDMGPNDPTMMG